MAGWELLSRPTFQFTPPPPYQPYEIHPATFTPKQCDRILTLGAGLEAAAAAIEGTHGAHIEDHEIRDSRTAWIQPTEENSWMFNRLSRLVERANRRYQFDLTGFGEDLQFTMYDRPGSFYSWHQDGLDGDASTRKLSIVVQLSDPADYSGAELQFFEVAEDYERDQLEDFTALTQQRGTAIVFPSFEYHRVLPLRSGSRSSLVAWVTGPPFR